MAQWKKIITSGSVAELNVVSASAFSGSFYGDGTNLTGVAQNIDDLSPYTGTVAQGDYFHFSDSGTEKKITFSYVEDSIFTSINTQGADGSDGDIQAAATGILTISASAVTNDKIQDGTIANVKLVNDGITIAGSDTSLGGTITADTIAGQISATTIANSQLVNDGITIAGSDTSLGGTITAATILGGDIGGNFTIGSESDDTATFTGPVVVSQGFNVSGNTVMNGDLTVQGTTTTISSTTLAVGDPFIFAATGSAGDNVDAGLVVQSGSAADSGSAIYHDIDSQRWAVAKQIASDGTSVLPSQNHGFVVTIKSLNLGGAAPGKFDNTYSMDSQIKSASYGVGEIIMDSSGDKDIWILGN